MVDEYSNLLTEDIPAIIEYLYYKYGKVRSEEVTQKDSQIIAIDWQPSDSLILLTCPIKNLQKLEKQVGIPYIDKQLLEKDFAFIRNTRDFEYALLQ